ncbi:succinate--CoA ligase subunit alpha [Candidatus Woesearchaeota archaeon]|nr:succinate--CoA ligase subunit alpha [Candidatus Woesearchaeota archaeon]
MSILVNQKTRVIVQGITGNQGSFHTKEMLDYGTNIVAGVRPGKGGQEVFGVPVFNTITEVLKEKKADWSILFVPAPNLKSAALEALNNNLNIIIITENVPIKDTIEIVNIANKKNLKVIGPNCPGVVSNSKIKIGIMPNHLFNKNGPIGVISRSGSLTYEISKHLSDANLGQSTVLGIGGDPIIGIDFIEALKLFEKDKETEKIVLVGEIGSDTEERAAEFISKKISKQVVAYIVGKTAPEGKRMGHAGAIISGNTGTALTKIQTFNKFGIEVAKIPSQIPKLLKN